MVQASTAALLFLNEIFGLCTCSLQGLFPEMGQAKTETNSLSFIYNMAPRDTFVLPCNTYFKYNPNSYMISER